MVIAPGEVEQPEPIADGERVKIQRVPLAAVRAIPGLVCHRLVSYPASSTAADRGQHNAMRGQRRCRETGTVTVIEHRSLLDHPPGFRPFRGTDLFERIGGQPAIDTLVDLLYEGIGDDDQLRPLFPRDIAHSRSSARSTHK